MLEHDLKQKLQAGELAANNGTIIRALALVGNDYQYAQLRRLQLALSGSLQRGAMCSAVNYLADSGYLAVRTVEEHKPSSVSDQPLEDLEVKLTPLGTQLQRGLVKDPLVDL